MANFGALEEPKVVFLHDRHTAALEKTSDWSKKQCNTCHLQDKNGRMSLKFARLDDASPDAVKGAYHVNCVKCHSDMASAGLQTGPIDAQCRKCHAKTAPASSWKAVSVDRALHYRHAKAYDTEANKCGACHHVVDKASGKTAPAAKEEDVNGSCAYCHQQNVVKQPGKIPAEIRSVRSASHDACVLCHQKNAAAGKDKPTGPVTCAGCHDAESQAKIGQNNAQKTVGADLRMKRRQPDTVLIRSGKPEAVQASMPSVQGKVEGPLVAGPVPFNHKLHEEKNATCASCHHASLASCAKECHTLAGDKKGGLVPLEKAMHSPVDRKSCVGCHAASQERKECAGCHSIMKKGVSSTAACKSCHTNAQDVPAQPDPAADSAAAAKLLQARPTETKTIAVDDIPENVVIKAMADQYEPSTFPHRRIVLSMVEKMKGDSLAAAFHDESSACKGCHHNSPASKRPPKCGNCHGASADRLNPAKPALKAAYHGQCMGCHAKMGIEGKAVSKAADAKPVPAAVDCTGCHKEKKK